MTKALLLFSAVIFTASVARSQAYTMIDNDGAIQLARGWKNDVASIEPPLVHISEASDGKSALTVLKETPADVEVDALGDYTSLKIELLGDSYPDFLPTAPKMGEVGGLPAAFFESSATVTDPNGVEFKADFVLMTLKGKEHFYLFLGLMQKDASSAAKGELINMLKSFKERG